MGKKVENNDRDMVNSILNYLHNESLDSDSPLEENTHVRLGDKKYIKRQKDCRKHNKRRRKRFKGFKKKI